MMLSTCLTPNRIKTHFFEKDDNYLATLKTIRKFLPCTENLKEFLWNTAALILRPDAVAGGQAENILPVLRDYGFVPVAFAPVSFSLAQTRELWRYQANVSTTERLRLLDLIMTSGPSVYILLQDQTVRNSAPATVHLTHLKGTAIVKNRRPWHLRTVTGPLVTNILSYVHVSDDPADVVREIGVLFSQQQCLELVKEAKQLCDRTEQVRELITELQSQQPRKLLDFNSQDLSINAQSEIVDWERILSTTKQTLDDSELRLRCNYIVKQSKHCKVFVGGDSYNAMDAMIPDDTELSLPLDEHLILPELGPR